MTLRKSFTHAGIFHTDDVVSAALLRALYPDMEIARVNRLPEDIGDALVFDIGGGQYDHHQADAKVRPDGVKYAAIGLLWADFGREYIATVAPDLDRDQIEKVWRSLDHGFIEAVDYRDNNGADRSGHSFDFADAVSAMNPLWNEEANGDDCFMDAVAFAAPVLKRQVQKAAATVMAEAEVEDAINNSDGVVVVLDRFVPWQGTLLRSGADKAKTALFIVFPSLRGGYNIQGVPVGNSQRCPFPEAWRGKSAEELQTLSGISGMNFCHQAGFMAAVATQDEAIRLAHMVAAGKTSAA